MENESVHSGFSRTSHLQSEQINLKSNIPSKRLNQHDHNHGGCRLPSESSERHLLNYRAESDKDDNRSNKILIKTNESYPEAQAAIFASRHQRNMETTDDDDLCDNVTVVTGATSDYAYSMDDIHTSRLFVKSPAYHKGPRTRRKIYLISVILLILLCCVTPIIMVTLPKIINWSLDSCQLECEGAILSLSLKILIFIFGAWLLFLRRGYDNLPKVGWLTIGIIIASILIIIIFWIFYGVRILYKQDPSYYGVINISTSFIEVLIFLYYLSVVTMEMQRLSMRYVIKIVRSPDGECKCYNVGCLSIQELAIFCLNKYQKDFQAYNPYLETLPRKAHNHRTPMNNFKLYDVDALPDAHSSPRPTLGSSRGSRVASVIGGGPRHRESHNDRFYDEMDYERKVARRRLRLIVSAEEAFMHVKRMQGNAESTHSVMSSEEAAQAIFPALVRPLQKYLRITRQQPRYSMENVLAHLASCIMYDMAPKAFVERYLTQGKVIWSDVDQSESESWILLSEHDCRSFIHDSVKIQLRRGPDVRLLIQVRKLPNFTLNEKKFDEKKNRFVLRLNADMSV